MQIFFYTNLDFILILDFFCSVAEGVHSLPAAALSCIKIPALRVGVLLFT